MDVARGILVKMPVKFFIVELFLDIITMQQKHIGHFEQIRIINAEVADYLENIGFHKWSRAYFPGNRYDVLTSNIAESVNAMFNEAREFPIIALFNDISKRWLEKFHERRMAYAKLKTTFVPSAETKIMANKNLGNKLLVHQIDEDTFSVTADNGIAMVHLRSKICSCREFDLDKIPYQHAMAALRHKFGDEYGKMIYEYSSPYYKIESYILAYADPIYPVPAEEFWNLPLEILERVIPPPKKKTKLGRKRLKRVPTLGEVVSKKRNKCSLCKRFGHKKTSCPTRSNEVAGTSNGVVS
ncbi:uncharacterized protein LOC125864245 [Solanum stenotomum]|uniref:uncharacterized protein LOC125864245 n=1 Tax=Solanum stenotomum TaxID=172797 RepID=UPI0020D040E6|nr:uncharacterized protein LOC125864245 [Solanum stenotomum]